LPSLLPSHPRRPRHAASLLSPIAAACAFVALPAAAQDAAAGIALQAAPDLQPQPRGDATRKLPIIVLAREVRGRPDLETIAEGDAELRRGGLVIRSDKLGYTHPDDLATATGNVRVSRDGNVYSGPEVQLRVQRFEGFFLNPTYHFGRIGAGGTASRIDFLDDQRAVASDATYTSCLADGTGTPAWLLSTDRVTIDLETNTGVAQGAVLRFMGVPILGAPVLSFPLTDARKSGWLPPSFGLDNKSGMRLSAPYYWNIATNRDATFTPGLSSRRGASIGTQFRYLEPGHVGDVNLDLLPHDRVAGRTRYAFHWTHDSNWLRDSLVTARVQRVSDNTYWKDFSRDLPTLTPRLLSADFQAAHSFGDWNTYARTLNWQVMQADDSRIDAPYERMPQIGARTRKVFGPGLEVGFEGEYNRFARPSAANDLTAMPEGSRVHALASIARPWTTPGWTITPKLALNAASYSLDQPMSDGRRSASRLIPTFSLDSGWVLERNTRWFGRSVVQTLEPRLLYVNTPFRDQSRLPNFDSEAKDFNFDSIYSENQFTGVDRVADAHQVTAGITTRIIDPVTGAEALRLGMVQRYLLRDQRVTPEGTPLTQRFSDLLLLGSTSLVRDWTLDSSVQYNADIKRTVRSIIGVRYSPGPFRTVNATYRQARGLTEQVELGWQWPIYGRTPDETRKTAGSAGGGGGGGGNCKGSLYSVGRVNYSMRDSRVTDAVLGFEYDSGCWIGRVVVERLSTGRSEATNRLLLQLELVGLSRLGSNPLQVLKDNIPGYRLLRDNPRTVGSASSYD